MRRLAAALALACAALALAVAPAQAEPFGLGGFRVDFTEADGSPATQAGAHPFAMTTSFFANTREEGGKTVPVEPIKDALFFQIPGFAGNPSAVPRCSTIDFLNLPLFVGGGDTSLPACADGSAVGVVAVYLRPVHEAIFAPVYLLEPAPGTAAKLGFWAKGVPVTADVGVSESPPYEVIGASTNISQILTFYGAELTLWGSPADPRHDEERGACYPEGRKQELEPGATCSAGASGSPFLTLPRACGSPLSSRWAADSWPDPGPLRQDGKPELSDPRWATGVAATPAFLGCGKLFFSPRISSLPTTRAAQSPSGLDFALEVPDEGLSNPEGIAGSDIERAVVALPEGMTINPSQAEGLEVCTESRLAGETAFSAPGDGCPQASKIGTIEVETPLLKNELLKGSLYVAEPYRNLAGNSLIAVYVVIKSAELGIEVIQPLRVAPDPRTGRLLTYSEDMPQLPFSHFRLHFREGGRAPLISPPGCGAFATRAVLYPSSGNPPVESTSTFQIVSGPGGSACPSGAAPFHPGFEAGTANNAAGSYSPFEMRITRQDGEQDLTKFSSILPPGVVGNLSGVPYCPEAGIAQAQGRSGSHGGTDELSDPSCPAASQIGATTAGAGVGSQLTYVGGRLYLAGPYHGDPLSVVSITPAVAGPFDAGTVVVRIALTLNPVTGEVEADGQASDPIPHILQGIPLNVRDLQVHIDRPQFTLNATSCEEEQTRATLFAGGTVLAPMPDTPLGLSARYQAADCASLGFAPRLGLKLRGGTRRGSFPALHAVYTPKPGEANLSRLALTFPHSEFIEQGHFRTICTRVQFAAGAGFGSQCPKGSVYGHIKVWTPLLDEPLSGPVYLRSSNHNLPDAVFALHGLVDIELATRIDSTHGRLRAIVSDSPDAPVSRAIVDMQGGQKGLFVNSTNLCAGKHRARVNAGGQNGRRDVTKPVMRAQCKKAHKKRHKGHTKKNGGKHKG